jgi:hypothetical protein
MSKRFSWGIAVLTVIVAMDVAAPLAVAKHGSEKNHAQGHRQRVIIAFGTMYGVDGPFVGETNAIRGVVGDEKPWKLTSARGFLGTDGHLRIRVRGLIFGDGSPNDETTFRGLVSCLTEDETAGTTPVVNVTTQGFPATPSGDSNIDAHVTLPNPCVAPVIFVLAGSEDKWFAVTGFESEGDSTSSRGHGDDQGEDD